MSESELDAAFDALEIAQRQLIADQNLYGISAGGQLTQTSPVPNLTVQAAGPCYGYDQLGQRLYFPGPTQTVNCALDSNNVSTSVAAGGNEKWVSVYLKFVRVFSDQRIDGNSQPIYYRRDEGYAIVVVQGAESAVGSASRPALDPTMVLLGDVRLVYGQTQIVNLDIHTERRQDTYVLSGPTGGASVRAGNSHDAILTMLAALNNHILGIAGVPAHPASAISTALGTAWLDGKQNPAADAQTQLNKLVADLGGVANADDGAMKIGMRAKAGARFSYGAGSIRANVEALAAQVDSSLTTGFDRIRYVADIAALRAIASAGLVNGSAAVIAGRGIFTYATAVTVADDGVHIVQPTDVAGGAPGRWCSPLGIEIAAASGIATLDATGKLTPAQRKNWLVDYQAADVAASYGSAAIAVNYPAFADHPGIGAITFAGNAKNGDILDLTAMGAYAYLATGVAKAGVIGIAITQGANTPLDYDRARASLLGTSNASDFQGGWSIASRFVLDNVGTAGTGTVVAKLRVQNASGSGAQLFLNGPVSLVGRLIRP